jgi:hypothetical protein
MNYSYTLGAGVVATVLNSKRRDREKLLNAFEQLTSRPNQKGDYTEQRSNRPVEVKRFDNWNVVFWHDPWSKEIRIVRVERVRI